MNEYHQKSMAEVVEELQECLHSKSECTPDLIDAAVAAINRTYQDTGAEALNEKLELAEQRRKVIEYAKKSDTLIIIAFSGGKDSVAMVLYCLFVLQIPKDRIELWHHDVDGHGEQMFDWKVTPDYCRKFADHFGLKLLFSYRDGGILKEMYRKDDTVQGVYYQSEDGGEYHYLEPDLWVWLRNQDEKIKNAESKQDVELVEILKEKREKRLAKDINTKRMFPQLGVDLQKRWCSSVAKIDVMRRAVRNDPRLKSRNLLVMTGERRVESTNREMYDEVEPYQGDSKREATPMSRAKASAKQPIRRAVLWRCILDWSHQDVWDIMEKHKIQPHPCYMIGWGRCSCQLCIYNEPDNWATLKEIDTKRFNRLAEVEVDLGHTLYVGETIEEYSTRTRNRRDGTEYKPESFFDKLNEKWLKSCLSETFDYPIIVKGKWMRPQGADSTLTCGAS